MKNYFIFKMIVKYFFIKLRSYFFHLLNYSSEKNSKNFFFLKLQNNYYLKMKNFFRKIYNCD